MQKTNVFDVDTWPSPSTSSRPFAQAHPQLRVQRGAARTKRRHFLRAIRRLAALGGTDLTILTVATAALEGFREATWSSVVTLTLFPSGFMGGWGSIAAIVVGLLFAGAYRSEERWRSSVPIFKGVALGSALSLWQSIDTLGILWTGHDGCW